MINELEKVRKQIGELIFEYCDCGSATCEDYANKILSYIQQTEVLDVLAREKKEHEDNPCWGCEYRKPDERDYINICLHDEAQGCIRDSR